VSFIKIISIIPARGGSKGIPRKNIKKLNGKPLIGYILETALKVEEIDRVIVSTDDTEIAAVAKEFGAEIPFLRPKELAEASTPTMPVLQHAVNYLEENENYIPDVVVLLYATSPLVTKERVSQAIKLLNEGNYDLVISVVEERGHFWIENNESYKRLYPKRVKNRQFTKPLYRENGAIYAYRSSFLKQTNSPGEAKTGFLLMLDRESIDIDEPIDFEIAEALLGMKVKEEQFHNVVVGKWGA
jgi:CMP-N-acetylneuraminic acid synthetase